MSTSLLSTSDDRGALIRRHLHRVELHGHPLHESADEIE
jgi:hypothetical protein